MHISHILDSPVVHVYFQQAIIIAYYHPVLQISAPTNGKNLNAHKSAGFFVYAYIQACAEYFCSTTK